MFFALGMVLVVGGMVGYAALVMGAKQDDAEREIWEKQEKDQTKEDENDV